jgi:cystathionine gamma-synthase
MTQDQTLKPSTLAAQALGWIDETTHAVVPPIHTSTTFIRDADNQYRNGLRYGRDDNPSYDQAEALLNTLEGGQGCLLFASGMAAATAVFQSLKPGDHVIAPTVMYWGLRKWLLEFATHWGLQVELVETGDIAELKRHLRRGETKLVWIETPANPTWVVTDIASWAAAAHKAGAMLAIDSTVATPVLTRPIEHGADIVMHAATKYLNGHGDVVGGALVTARDDGFWQRIVRIRHDSGAIIGPFEAWLLLRGLRTLYIRVERCSANAMALAAHFAKHAKILAVHYPGLAADPGQGGGGRGHRGGRACQGLQARDIARRC